MDGKSIFGTPSQNNTPAQPSTSIFGRPSASQPQSREETMDTEDGNEAEKPAEKPSLFESGSGQFKLGSTFQKSNDPKEQDRDDDEDSTPQPKKQTSLFGAGFGKSLSEAQSAPTPIKEEPGKTEIKINEIPPAPEPPTSEPTAKPAAAPTTGGFVDAGRPSPFMPPTKPTTPPATSGFPFFGGVQKEQPKPSPLRESHTQKEPDLPEPEELPPLAGSPPVSVKAPSSPMSSLPSSRGEEEAEKADKGKGNENDEQESAPVDDAPLPPDPSTAKKPSWWNEDINNLATPSKASEQPLKAPSAIRPPAPTPPATSHTPFGLPKPATVFPPPVPKPAESPRSPSPVRSASQPVGPSKSHSRPPSRPVARIPFAAPSPPPPPPPQPTTTDLSDDEDERIRDLLDAPLKGTKNLDDFIAHQTYAGDVQKSGIPGQIEKVYRDINSMLDTLGLNMRSLASFLKGHSEFTPDEGRTADDLDVIGDPITEDWCLVEVEDLAPITDYLHQTLEQGRLQDPGSILEEVRGMSKATRRTRQSTHDVRRALAPMNDPTQAAVASVAPLDPKQSADQVSVRDTFSKFQTTLAKAEEGLLQLKATIATSGRGGVTPPSAEHVKSAIEKMTSMIEGRRTDLDVLDTVMTKLSLASSRQGTPASIRNSPALLRGTPRRFGEGSPFSTPNKAMNGRGGSYGLDLDDSSDEEDGVVVKSIENGSAVVKKEVSPEIERKAAVLAERKGRQKAVGRTLRDLVLERGPTNTRTG